ncbi:hypothetical protein [Nocardia sp. NPDC004123]
MNGFRLALGTLAQMRDRISGRPAPSDAPGCDSPGYGYDKFGRTTRSSQPAGIRRAIDYPSTRTFRTYRQILGN